MKVMYISLAFESYEHIAGLWNSCTYLWPLKVMYTSLAFESYVHIAKIRFASIKFYASSRFVKSFAEITEIWPFLGHFSSKFATKLTFWLKMAKITWKLTKNDQKWMINCRISTQIWFLGVKLRILVRFYENFKKS